MDTKLRLPNRNGIICQRVRAFRFLILAAFAGLLTRLWYLQVVKGEEFDVRAQGVRVRSIYLPAPRGIIYDRRGRILATSRSSYSLSIVPAYMGKHRSETTRRLGEILNMSPEEIEAILQRTPRRSFDPVVIQQEVDLATLTRVEENRSRLPGVQVESRIRRRYPRGRLAAHALGYVGEISEKELAAADHNRWRLGDPFGKFGVECSYNRNLHGVKGVEQIEVNATGHPTRWLGERMRVPGNSVVLTLDADVQKAAEEGLTETGRPGSVVAMDVHTGAILALASKPDFDPNSFGEKMPPELWNQLLGDRRRPLMNRALSSKFPPGSTFKIITALAALEAGAVDPDVRVNCSGSYRLGRVFRCWKHSGHGSVNLQTALGQSCDVYFYTVGRKVGPEKIAEMSHMLGLGSRTGVDLPGEVLGTVPTPKWKRKYLGERWYPGDTLNMAIGQGFVETTPLQMTRATVVVANGGFLVQPHLLNRILSPTGEDVTTDKFISKHLPLHTGALTHVRRGMRDAVVNGTARVLNMPRVAIAAKTGTAEDARASLPHAWVVSFAPYDSPRVAVTVFVENAGHGGEVAAPIARKVYEAIFARNKQWLAATPASHPIDTYASAGR